MEKGKTEEKGKGAEMSITVLINVTTSWDSSNLLKLISGFPFDIAQDYCDLVHKRDLLCFDSFSLFLYPCINCDRFLDRILFRRIEGEKMRWFYTKLGLSGTANNFADG